MSIKNRSATKHTKMSRASSRSVKARWVPTYNVLTQALVAGIDSGDKSGYSMWQCGMYAGSDLAKTAEQRERCVQIAYRRSLQLSLPLIFIAEDWPSGYKPDGKRMSHKSILGMGMNWGKWLQEIEKLPQPKNLDKIKILRVDNQVWRKPYGLDKYHRKEAKEQAILICQQTIDDTITDDNQAEATLIGKFGCGHVFK